MINLIIINLSPKYKLSIIIPIKHQYILTTLKQIYLHNNLQSLIYYINYYLINSKIILANYQVDNSLSFQTI